MADEKEGAPPVTAYEYMVFKAAHSDLVGITAILNENGAQGFRLVSMALSGQGQPMLFVMELEH